MGMAMAKPEVHAAIHEYTVLPNGFVHTDEDGEPLIGFYYQFVSGRYPISSLMGPYHSKDEVEAAAQKAWGNGEI
jgi:hypothetical protein